MAVFSINNYSPDTQLPAAWHTLGGGDVMSHTIGHRCHPACLQGEDWAPCCWAAMMPQATLQFCHRGSRKGQTDSNPNSDSQVYKVPEVTQVKRVPQVQKDREDFQDTWG